MVLGRGGISHAEGIFHTRSVFHPTDRFLHAPDFVELSRNDRGRVGGGKGMAKGGAVAHLNFFVAQEKKG